METKQAVDILTQVAFAAQKGGLLTLQEAVITAQAIEKLTSLVIPNFAEPSANAESTIPFIPQV